MCGIDIQGDATTIIGSLWLSARHSQACL